MLKFIAICITALTLAGCYTPPPAPPSSTTFVWGTHCRRDPGAGHTGNRSSTSEVQQRPTPATPPARPPLAASLREAGSGPAVPPAGCEGGQGRLIP